ncbi:hypothetical protein CMV_017263 [Castanea mollissima]|uniref:ABC transporter domain-containing protein n=1 Tax=Castanea mollissima TaxID=60419 RepID=A0A8J4QTB3_9ROSI|nr:hypothetical protein CMV_017263 [Castanea mollissima]
MEITENTSEVGVDHERSICRGMHLVWEDLTVVVPNFGNGHTRRLLDGLSGYAEPGRIMAIMGPSGSGKSTLLDSLAGRLSGNVVMTGNVLLNGKKRRLDYGVLAYVTQEDILLGTLTVRETLTYSANLRLPTSMTIEEVNGIVEGTIIEMGLQECADRLIGNWHLRVYFGPANLAIEFFANAGFPCPSRRNPSDHFLRCINSDFDVVTMSSLEHRRIREIQKSSDPMMNLAAEEIKAKLIEKYRCSEYATSARIKIREIPTVEGLAIERKGGSQAKWWKQLSTLTQRSFVNMSRDVGYYWLRIIVYITLSLCVGTIFYDIGTSYTAILARGACGGFVAGFMTFMSIGGFPSFLEEMKVFYRERLSGHYGIAVYVLSNFLSSFPFVAVMSIATGTITNYMVKFRPEFSHLVYICLDLIGAIAVVESSMMIIASLVPNFLMGIIIGAGYIGIMMMTAGYFRLLPDLPKPFWRYPISYINYGAWAIQGAYKNDMIGLEFDSFVPGGPKLKGEVILSSMLGVQLDHSKWWDLGAVAVILISCRLLFFAILKFKERASPCFRTLYTKQTLHYLNKRPSFRKTPPFPSKRHQPLHSLSSQEGLNSPLH